MKKIIKNTTLVDIIIKPMGLSVPANSFLLVEPSEYRLWMTVDVIASVLPNIVSGDLVVNDGSVDLDSDEGIHYLSHPGFAKSTRFEINALAAGKQFTKKNTQNAIEESFPRIVKDASPVENTAREIEFTGNGVSITNPSSNKVVIDIPSVPNSTICSIYQIDYALKGSANNKFLGVIGESKSSNDAPGVVVWDSDLIGMSFTNYKPGADFDIQVIHVDSGIGAGPNTVLHTWSLTNVRVGRRNDLSIPVNYGDKMAIYIKDTGKNPHSVRVSLFFKITNVTPTVTTEDFSGNISATGGGGSSS